MAHLLPTYARTTGLRIGPMQIFDAFYPLGFEEPFIVVITSTGGPSKNYSHYKIVTDALKPLLIKNGFKLVQLGGKDDERVGADLDLCGQTTTHQYFNVLKRAILIICGDTSAVHVGGHFDKKIVTLYSISAPKMSGAYFGKSENQKYLTPKTEEGAFKFSLNPNESPRTIDLIKPEEVIKATCELLKWEFSSLETINIGHDYKISLIESIPDSVIRPDFMPQQILNIRLDKGGKEELALEQLKYRKCVILTDKPVNTAALLQLKPNLEGIVYIVKDTDDPSFVKFMHENGIPYRSVSFLPEEVLKGKKLDYIDFNLLERKDKTTKENIKEQGKITKKTLFSTNKKILSEGKFYLTHAHKAAGISVDNWAQNEDTIIDSPEFWEDLDFYYIFNK